MPLRIGKTRKMGATTFEVEVVPFVNQLFQRPVVVLTSLTLLCGARGS